MTVEETIQNFSLNDLPGVWSQQILPMVQENGKPPYYLMGGAITRVLINKLYGVDLSIKDYDVVVGEFSTANPQLMEWWRFSVNMYGNWTFSNDLGVADVDVWPFNKWIRSKPVSTIEEAIENVPVNIHAVVYDIINSKIYYHPDYVQALTDRKVKVKSDAEHKAYCELAKISQEEDLRTRAERIGFEYEYNR